MAPRDGGQTPGGVPLEDDWPDLDAASHRFRVDYGAVQDAGDALAAQVGTYQQGPGSPGRLTGMLPNSTAWGTWEAAAPLHAAAQQAMRHVLQVYRLLLKDYEAASHLLMRTAQNYAEADAVTRASNGVAGGDANAGVVTR